MVLILKSISDYYKLYSIMEKEISNTTIELIVEWDFLEPMDVLILTQFIIRQKQRSCNITVSASNKKILEYLTAISIVEFCSKNVDISRTLDAIPSYTAMPIRRVEKETMSEYINSTQIYFKLFCDGKDLSMLDLCLSELINNVYDHSHSPIGAYVFCQYYPKSKEIKMAVSDLGIGIPMSVNNYKIENKEPILTSKESVLWALEENKTIQSIPQNRGKGLDNVKTFMQSNSCFWRLYTNDVLMNGGPIDLLFKDNPIAFFKGTLAQLDIKIEKLPNSVVFEESDWY